jgi:hypothetical protein
MPDAVFSSAGAGKTITLFWVPAIGFNVTDIYFF